MLENGSVTLLKGASPMAHGLAVKKNPLVMQEMQKTWVLSLRIGKILRRRASFQYSCLENSMDRGLQSMVGYSPWGCKELDMPEVTEHNTSKEREKTILVWLGRPCHSPSLPQLKSCSGFSLLFLNLNSGKKAEISYLSQ